MAERAVVLDALIIGAGFNGAYQLYRRLHSLRSSKPISSRAKLQMRVLLRRVWRPGGIDPNYLKDQRSPIGAVRASAASASTFDPVSDTRNAMRSACSFEVIGMG